MMVRILAFFSSKDDAIMHLTSDVKAKEHVIEILRDQMNTDRQLLVETTRRLGQVEERLGIAAPEGESVVNGQDSEGGNES